MGSLIGFRTADSTEPVHAIGIVNSVFSSKQNSTIYFSIQLLNHNFGAQSYTLPAAIKKDESQKALFYTKTESEREKTYIIIDNFNLKEGDIIHINREGGNSPFMLSDRKNIALGYWLFSCEKHKMLEKANGLEQSDGLIRTLINEF